MIKWENGVIKILYYNVLEVIIKIILFRWNISIFINNIIKR